MQQTYRYRNIIIKPHWMQFVINELHLLVLISVGFVYAGLMMPSSPLWCLSSRSCFPYVWHIGLSIYAGCGTSSVTNNWCLNMACFIGK